jgi:hypothetical protein
MGDFLMNQKIRPDLEEILRLGAAGLIYMEHFERWQRFKEQWTVDDRTRWQLLFNRIHKKPDGTIELKPPLSDLEKQWAKDLVRRAEALDLC